MAGWSNNRGIVQVSDKGELILCQTEDGKTKVEVRLQDETVWLTQKLMAELFQKDVRTVNEHIKNIFIDGDLSPESVIRNFRITAAAGKMRERRTDRCRENLLSWRPHRVQ